jgi:hypothetical protein
MRSWREFQFSHCGLMYTYVCKKGQLTSYQKSCASYGQSGFLRQNIGSFRCQQRTRMRDTSKCLFLIIHIARTETNKFAYLLEKTLHRGDLDCDVKIIFLCCKSRIKNIRSTETDYATLHIGNIFIRNSCMKLKRYNHAWIV